MHSPVTVERTISNTLTDMQEAMSLQSEPVGATLLVFYLGLFFLGSYVGGRIYNRVRINRLRSTVGAALRKFDSGARVRAVGTKMLSFSGKSLGKIIGEYSLAVFVMGRENLLNWGLARIAGRGDMAILRARVRGKILGEVDLIRKRTPPHKRFVKTRSSQGVVKDFGEMMAILRSTTENLRPEEVAKTAQELERVDGLWSFSLRRDVPELVVNLSLRKIATGELEEGIRRTTHALKLLTGNQ